MKKNNLVLGFNKLGFDIMYWDNDRITKPSNCIISLPLSKAHLEALNKFICDKKTEVLNDVPDYFEKFNEPFPLNELEILHNPKIIEEYFSRSDLWAHSIMFFLSKLLNWDFKNSEYDLLKLESASFIGNDFNLNFYAFRR